MVGISVCKANLPFRSFELTCMLAVYEERERLACLKRHIYCSLPKRELSRG